MRLRPTVLASVLAALALPGCSGGREAPAEAAAVHLSEADRNANAGPIAAFFARTCLAAGESATALAGALQGSGWQHDQVQTPSGAIPVAGWRLDRGELVHSALTLGTDNNFIDCELVLDAEVVPTLERMRDALRPLVRHATLREVSAGPPEARWQWSPAPRDERVLTVGPARRGTGRPGAAPGLSLHLRITETALVAPAPPPELNEIGAESGNVQ